MGFLAANRRRLLEGENLDHLWGTANLITLARGGLLALLAGFLFAPEASGPRGWLPALLYTAAAAADALDGFWARRTGTGTRLGELLDGELDGVGLLVAVALAVQYGRLPAAFLAIGLAKPAYAAALAVQRLAGGRARELPPSYLRRRLAGFQMGLVAVFLWPLAGAPGTTLAGALIGIPFLAGFLRDGLAAVGLLDTAHPVYRRWKARLGRLAFAWTPPVLRGAAGAAAALRITAALAAGLGGRAAPGTGPGAATGAALGAWRGAVGFLPAAVQPAAAALAAVLQLAALAMLAAGSPRRAVPACALLVLLIEGLRAFQGPWDPLGALVLGAALLLLLLRPAPRRAAVAQPAGPAAEPVTARRQRSG